MHAVNGDKIKPVLPAVSDRDFNVILGPVFGLELHDFKVRLPDRERVGER